MLDRRLKAAPARPRRASCPTDTLGATVVASTATSSPTYAHVCGFTLRDDAPAHLPARARLRRCTWTCWRRRPFPRRRRRPHRQPDRPAPADPRSASRSPLHASRRRPASRTGAGAPFDFVGRGRASGDELVWEGFAHQPQARRRRRRRGRRAEPRSRTAPVTATLAARRRPRPPLRARSPATTTRSTCTRWAAKPFGFPRAIAHGMWTKARCLASLRLPDALRGRRAASRSRSCCPQRSPSARPTTARSAPPRTYEADSRH